MGRTQTLTHPKSQNENSWLLRLCVLTFLLVGVSLAISGLCHAERARPVRIGALTDAWGSTPHIVGLRDGLVELGYQQDQDFFLGIRFTDGSLIFSLTY